MKEKVISFTSGSRDLSHSYAIVTEELTVICSSQFTSDRLKLLVATTVLDVEVDKLVGRSRVRGDDRKNRLILYYYSLGMLLWSKMLT